MGPILEVRGLFSPKSAAQLPSVPPTIRPRELPMSTSESTSENVQPVVQIGVFAAQNGWLLTHPAVHSRFEDRDEAMAAARRLAHLENWRGRAVDVLVQDGLDARLARLEHDGVRR